jgi:phosphatidylglycerophosphatase A
MISDSMAEATRAPASASQRLARLVATGLGSGYSPFAPGTAGSLVGLALYWPLARLEPAWLVAAIVVLFFVGVAAATSVARQEGLHDPGIVVVDEVIGMWISLAFLPLTPITALAGFLLFRVMDIVKPPPARGFERFPGGWGIMADDVMAGVYANLVLRLALWAVPA